MKLLFTILAVFTLLSPDGKIKAELNADKSAGLKYSLYADGQAIIVDSPVSLTLEDGKVLCTGSRPSARKSSSDNLVSTVVYKKAEVRDCYNALTLKYKNYDVEFRAYDDGLAYRFVTDFKKPFKVASEQASFNFAGDFSAWVPYVCQHTQTLESQLWNSFENTYEYIPLSGWNKERLAFMPLLVNAGAHKVCITESNLLDYPGMFLYGGEGTALEGVFAAVPDEVEQGGHNMLQGVVKSRKPYIAELPGKSEMPWRIVCVTSDDARLADNDLVYVLAKKDDGRDWSWLKPGKVAWDWWNHWNVYGVDFKAGINNRTYEYYIDFAAAKGIEYVILDEGWAVNKKADLMQVVPEIDIAHLCSYAQQRGVGIVLWAGYYAFDRDMENICRHYASLGVKGWKIDFLDRDDQDMVKFCERAAATAARYRQFVDFHGVYKPAGLNRTWPNVLNFEGVHGLEQMKWERETKQIEYDVTIPYIRMFAGPMDYTPGAMLNASAKDYVPCNHAPMSIGTRCRQLAMYVVYDSPFGMLCDTPTHYLREPECTRFIADVPTVWTKTTALEGKVGEYIVMAREGKCKKCGKTVWYVAAMGPRQAKDVEIDLSFLPEGKYSMTEFKDGANAELTASDFARVESKVSSSSVVKVHMAPAGGWAAVIKAE